MVAPSGWTSTGTCIRNGCSAEVVLPDLVYKKVYRTGESFYCYMGHGQSYPGEDEEKRRKQEREKLERRAREAEEQAREAAEAQDAALKARRKAERTCPWPTCEGKVLRSPKMLRQHLVDVHGAPWATAEVSADEVAQVLTGRDHVEVVK